MIRFTGVVCLALMLSACNKNISCSEKNKARDENKNPLAFLHHLKNRLPQHFSMAQLKEYIHEGDLKTASRYVNLAIKTSVTNPALHVINGFIYEEMLRAGDSSCAHLAGVAYRTAHDLDPSHWLYAYLVGSYELRERHYDKAQEYLANALLLRPEHEDTLYALACASYYLHDIPVALNSIQKAVACNPNSPSLQRSAAIIFAAAGKFEKANQALACYSTLSGKTCCADVERVRSRIEDWKTTHQQAKCYRVDNQVIDYGTGEKAPDDAQVLAKSPTVVLDCYLLQVLESTKAAKGNNIFNATDQMGALNPLTVVLGGSGGIGQPASDALFGTSNTRQSAAAADGSGQKNVRVTSWTQTFNYSISPSNLTYSLNIANAADSVVEFSARPSISTLVGEPEPARFLNADIVVGTPQGGSQLSVDAGVKLECKPVKIASDGCITLAITITVSELNGYNVAQGIGDQLISVSKAKASTTLQVFPGQTIMVAGIKVDTRVLDDSGVPLLRSLPFVQYFFSNVRTSSVNRSLVYLLTPRLGGGEATQCKSSSSLSSGPSSVAKKLHKGGLELGRCEEYSVLYYILKYFEQSPLFADFRSGDITPPFWGYENVSLPQKLNQLSSFLYF